jgi:hypothetical protein
MRVVKDGQMKLASFGALLFVACSSDVPDDAAVLIPADSGAIEDALTHDDAADTSVETCAAPQPRCPSPIGGGDDTICCTQATACGVCYGDSFPRTRCVDGEWRCPSIFILFADCRSTWSPYADAGPFPACDGGE